MATIQRIKRASKIINKSTKSFYTIVVPHIKVDSRGRTQVTLDSSESKSMSLKEARIKAAKYR